LKLGGKHEEIGRQDIDVETAFTDRADERSQGLGADLVQLPVHPHDENAGGKPGKVTQRDRPRVVHSRHVDIGLGVPEDVAQDGGTRHGRQKKPIAFNCSKGGCLLPFGRQVATAKEGKQVFKQKQVAFIGEQQEHAKGQEHSQRRVLPKPPEERDRNNGPKEHPQKPEPPDCIRHNIVKKLAQGCFFANAEKDQCV